MWILVGFAVFILVVSVIVILAPSPSPNVIITGITIDSQDNVCGLNGATGAGYDTNTSSSDTLTYQISGANSTTGPGTLACTISSVTTTTPGFSITGANTPLVIPANETQDLSFTVNTPPDPYTGVLTLVMS